jgi:hypothetical protein
VRLSRSTAALSAVFAAFTLTITPTSHDYGEVAVNAQTSKDFVVAGVANGDSALAILTGPDANQWKLQGWSVCHKLDSQAKCSFEVDFWPKSVGPKTAALVVRDSYGNRVTAQLKGKAVQPICESKVVFCNYAHLYKGVFSWNDALRGGNSSTVIVMQADIDGLSVKCNGTETITGQGTTQVLTSNGSGLVAVEFKVDDTMRQVYNITVACPSPGNADTPSQRAELGHFDQQTYDQQTTNAGVPVTPGVDLIGSSSYENPANDPVNGVTGTVTVKWNLKRVR